MYACVAHGSKTHAHSAQGNLTAHVCSSGANPRMSCTPSLGRSRPDPQGQVMGSAVLVFCEGAYVVSLDPLPSGVQDPEPSCPTRVVYPPDCKPAAFLLFHYIRQWSVPIGVVVHPMAPSDWEIPVVDFNHMGKKVIRCTKYVSE